MKNTAIKQKHITNIPTELNFYYNLNTKVKKLRQQGNTSRILIIFLILWNLVVTLNFIPAKTTIPQITDKQNEQIMMLEEIPEAEFENIGE